MAMESKEWWGWQRLREKFEKAIVNWETQLGEVFPEEEKSRIEATIRHVAGKFKEGQQMEWDDAAVVYFLFQMLSGVRIGFMPKDFISKDLGGVLFEMQEDNGTLTGTWSFLKGCVDFTFGRYAEAKDNFDRAFERFLSKKLLLQCMQLRAWCCVHLEQWDEALSGYQALAKEVNASHSKEVVQEGIGYIKALRLNAIMPLEYYYLARFPSEEFEDTVPAAEVITKKADELSPENVLSLFREELMLYIRLSLWQVQERLTQEVKEVKKIVQPSLESTEERLGREQGQWVDKLANKGALVNAEFLYSVLSRRSWGGVVAEYSNAVEAEVRERLFKPYESFLIQKGWTLKELYFPDDKYNKTADKCDLGDAERILRNPKFRTISEEFLSRFRIEDRTFLLNELPDLLKELRELRNPSTHGEIIKNAKRARELVLSAPGKFGLLKRLAGLNL